MTHSLPFATLIPRGLYMNNILLTMKDKNDEGNAAGASIFAAPLDTSSLGKEPQIESLLDTFFGPSSPEEEKNVEGAAEMAATLGPKKLLKSHRKT